MNSSPAGDACARRDRMIRALKDFQEPAQAAARHWGRQDLTVGQGLAITWLLGNIIRDLRIATASAGNLRMAEGPSADTGAELHRLGYGVPRRPATPGGEIAHGVYNLHMAWQQARTASARYGPRPGAWQPHNVPAVAAARQMQAALGAADGVWLTPAGGDRDRDLIVTQLLYCVDKLEIATIVLSQGGPADLAGPLQDVAFSLDCCCHALRESLACSLTGGYQPGTEDLARQVRAGHPLISETSQSPFPPLLDFSDSDVAPATAATPFPFPAGTATSAGEPSPEARPARQQRLGTSRRNP